MRTEDLIRFFFRGAFGGVVGNCIKAILAWLVYSLILKARFGYYGNAATFPLFAVMGIPAAAITGAIVGMMIGTLSAMRRRSIGVLMRAFIGVSFLVLCWLMVVAYDKIYPDTNRWSYKSSTWMILSLFYVDFGVIIGAAAGIMSPNMIRSQAKAKDRPTQ